MARNTEEHFLRTLVSHAMNHGKKSVCESDVNLTYPKVRWCAAWRRYILAVNLSTWLHPKAGFRLDGPAAQSRLCDNNLWDLVSAMICTFTEREERQLQVALQIRRTLLNAEREIQLTALFPATDTLYKSGSTSVM